MFSCNVEGCEKRFKSALSLSRHSVFHNYTKKNDKYVCDWPECKNSFKAKINVSRVRSDRFFCNKLQSFSKFKVKESHKRQTHGSTALSLPLAWM